MQALWPLSYKLCSKTSTLLSFGIFLHHISREFVSWTTSAVNVINSQQVFLFLALDDPPDGKISMWRVQRDAEASQLQHRPRASSRFTPKSNRNSLFLCERWQWDDQMHQMLRYCKDLLNPVYTEWGALEVCVSVSFLYMPFYSESDFLIVCSVSLEFIFEFLYFHLLNLGSCLLHTRCQSTTIAVLGVSRAMLCRQSCGTYQVGGTQQCRRNTSNVRSTSSL